MRILFYLAAFVSLVACSTTTSSKVSTSTTKASNALVFTVPTYIDPPEGPDTARLRVVVQQGLIDTALLYPDAPGLCFEGKIREAQMLPIHLNTTIWRPQAKKKIGMPFVDEYSKLYGAEFYIDTKSPLLLTNQILKNNFYTIGSCLIGFKYQFEAGKDYQLMVSVTDKTCSSELTDITNFNPTEKSKVVPIIPLIMPGNPLWNALCTKPKDSN